MIRRLSALIAGAAVLLAAGVVFGQSYFLEKGQSRGVMSAAYASGSGASGYAGGLGISIDGTYDIGLHIERTEADVGDLIYVGYTPYASANFVKPTESLPLGVVIGASGSTGFFSSDALTRSLRDMSSKGYSFDGNVYTSFDAGEVVRIYPSVGVSRVASKLEDRLASGDETSRKTHSTLLLVGVSALVNETVAAGVDVSFDDGDSVTQVSVSYLF